MLHTLHVLIHPCSAVRSPVLCSDTQNAGFHPVTAACCWRGGLGRGGLAGVVSMAAQRRGAPPQQSPASRSGELEHLQRMSCPCVQFCNSYFCATKSLLIIGFTGDGKGIFASGWVFSSKVMCGNLGMGILFFF